MTMVKYPCLWHCKTLNKLIQTSQDALPDLKLGFMCDCVDYTNEQHTEHKIHWVLKSDSTHTVLAYREYSTQGFPYDIINKATTTNNY